MKTLAIVVGLVRHRERLLMLRRAADKRFAPGKWEPVGGFISGHVAAEAAIVERARQRAGLDVRIVRAGTAFECEDAGAWWIVKPFLLEPLRVDPPIDLGDDHVDHAWVTLDQMQTLDCVDGMPDDLRSLGLAV
jgi:ADP-ribose pyrophosphatase YjhB (NUDIX family)